MQQCLGALVHKHNLSEIAYLTVTLPAILFHSFEMYNFCYENFKKLPGFTLILPVLFINEDCIPIIMNNLDRKVVTKGEKNLLFFVLIL